VGPLLLLLLLVVALLGWLLSLLLLAHTSKLRAMCCLDCRQHIVGVLAMVWTGLWNNKHKMCSLGMASQRWRNLRRANLGVIANKMTPRLLQLARLLH
jgi:hypothetical protein